MIAHRILILASLSCFLAACGGGGGGGGTGNTPPTTPPPGGGTPDPGPSADAQTRAQNAKVRMRIADETVLVTWFDAFSNEVSYLLERQLDNGAWTTEATLPAQDGITAEWWRDLNGFAAGTYRVSAVFSGYTLPLHTVPGETTISVDPTALPEIHSDPPSPDGSRQVSVTNAESALSVTYILGKAPMGTVTGGGTFATTLPAERMVVTVPQLYAEVQMAAALTVRVAHWLNFGTSRPTVLLYVEPAMSISNSLELWVMSTSGPGIVSVALFMNGNPLKTLTKRWSDSQWLHILDATTLPAGTNTFRAVATDANGATVSMSVDYTQAGPPLQVEGVFDGMISRDRISAHATFGNNDGTTVLSVTLGNTLIARTRTSPFDLSHALAAWPPGDTRLVFRAEDAAGRRSELIYPMAVSSTARSYELITNDVSKLLAASDGALLYRRTSGDVILRSASGVETTVQGLPDVDFFGWWLTNGYIVAQEYLNGHLHVVTAPGQTIDLNATTPPSNGIPYAHGDWMSLQPRFAVGFETYYLPSGDTAFRGVTIPGHTRTLGEHSFISEPTNESVVFSGIVDGTAGIYRHRLFAGTTQRLMTGTYRILRSDRTRLAVSDGTTLWASTWANPTALTMLAMHEGDIWLEDGLLYWQGLGYSLYINDGTTTTKLSDGSAIEDNAIEDSYILFYDNDALHSWHPTSGKNLVLQGTANRLHTQGVAYLRTGRLGALYRTTLL